jgi:hypothetical protein
MSNNNLDYVQKYHSIEDFFKYKNQNTQLPEELKEYYNGINNRRKRVSIMQPDEVRAYLITHIQKRNMDNGDEQLYSKIQELLNKLSGNNFDSIANEIKDLPYVKRKHVFTLCEKLSVKAIYEPTHSDTYSKLCNSLIPYYIKEQTQGVDRDVHFRLVLLNICQDMFEELVTGKKKENLTYERTVDYSKLKLTGVCKFLADLYNNNVLNEKIIEQCFNILYNQLLNGIDHFDAMAVFFITFIKKMHMTHKQVESKMIDKLDKIRFEKDGFKFSKVNNKFKILEIYDELEKLKK